MGLDCIRPVPLTSLELSDLASPKGKFLSKSWVKAIGIHLLEMILYYLLQFNELEIDGGKS